ncbi:MAG TPA: PDZ domain-containing protein [Gemmatimonadales bacterium]|nr:PDZ domain-containing protein [Gemmatimonadales bacterium]
MTRSLSTAAACLLGIFGGAWPPSRPRPQIAYAVRLDTEHLAVVEMAIRLRNVPTSVELAMKVHPEYDAHYWRYIDSLRVEGTADDAAASVLREDSTLWRVILPGGHGVVRYRVRIQPPQAALRRAWLPYTRADGALINPPDFFLYLPDFSDAPVTVDLDIPSKWEVATALPSRGAPTRRSAPDAATLLDSPILVGALHDWSFVERGTMYHVVYWPLPAAARFDSIAFVDGIRRLTGAVLDVFRHAPSSEFYFLVQDGAVDALEHRASLTIGVPSERLARDPHASLTELAHEFFHTWNLVAIRPAGYNALSYRAPARTPGLWLGEGVTLYYADVFPRRAALADSSPTRLDHLGALLERYYGSPAILRVPPERASLAFGDSPGANSDATGGYYLQGELLGNVLDATVRTATGERRGLDDAMRALFERSRLLGDGGYTEQDLESVIDSVCGCGVEALFVAEVRGPGPIDVEPVLARLGLQLALDSVPATDSLGRARPDLRLGTDFTAPPGVVRLVVNNPATPWAVAGLRSGDELVALNGIAVGSFAELQAVLRDLHVGDHVTVEVRRDGRQMTVTVTVTGYTRPRVRFSDTPTLTPEQRARRSAWLAGR